MNINIFEIIYYTYMVLSIGFIVAKWKEPYTIKNGWTSLLTAIIMVVLVYLAVHYGG